MTLKINNVDYSNRIIAGSYDVNSEDEFKSWTDANGITHRQIIRSKIKGSFDMWVKDPSEYSAFLNVLDGAKKSNLSYRIVLDVNNTGESVEKDFYLNFAPVRNINQKWQDYMERFKVTIEER